MSLYELFAVNAAPAAEFPLFAMESCTFSVLSATGVVVVFVCPDS